MANNRGDGTVADSGAGSPVWRRRIAILVAVALATAGLLLYEHKPAASPSSAPHVVHTATHTVAAVSTQVAVLTALTTKLRGASSVLKQTLPDLDAPTAARTTAVAASIDQDAALSQKLASLSQKLDTSTARANANTTAAQLTAGLTSTQAQANVISAVPLAKSPGGIKFCKFTIQIGPIVINIPQIGFHLVIGPFFIHFRAPCFLSGVLPTHVA